MHRDLGRLARRARALGWGVRRLAILLPVLLATQAAHPASILTNVGPRISAPVGPRGPTINSVGPRFDPSFHGTPPGGDNANNPGANNSAGSNNGYPRTNSRATQTLTRRNNDDGVPPPSERRYAVDQVVIEIVGNPSDQRFNALLNRLHLSPIETRRVPLINTTFHLVRITDRGSVTAKIRALNAAGGVRSQPNYLFGLVQTSADTAAAATATAAAEAPDPSQYAVAKLHLDEAHRLALGDNVRVAVIDSGIDTTHPALAGVVEKSFDALNSTEGPHSHGTSIAGIIAGHGHLSGAAPAVRILAARAFSTTQGSTVSIIASLDWAVGEHARVVNMSFAGPSDPALERALKAASEVHHVVLVAATGNAGPKSPPLWPAADPHVIGVTATDYDDHLFSMANRGRQVAIAAPGVDILVALPGNAYKMESGTSFSAAFVSGVAALLIQRDPKLTPDAVAKIIEKTAHRVGQQKARDDLFGAGLMDAFQAVAAVAPAPTDAALQVPSR
jgi:subtilisin family serine protease